MTSIWEPADHDTAPREKRERAGGRVVLVLVLVLVLLAGGGYAAAHYLAGDNVPRGTTVAGIAIGGRTPAEAADLLRAELDDRATAPLEVLVDGSVTELDPVGLGLAIDYEASVRTAGGGESWDPQRLWDYYTGGGDLDPVVTVDEAALEAGIAALVADVAQEPVDGAVDLRGGRIRVTDPVVGRGLDPDVARAAVLAAYLSEDPAEVSTVEVAPDIDEADIRTAVDDFANPALSSAVTLEFGRSRVRLQPEQYVGALSLEPVDGVLVPQVDQTKIVRLVKRATVSNGDPVDARIELVDGKPRVIPSKPGVTFEPDDIGAAFLEGVVEPDGERAVPVAANAEQPDFTTRDAKALKVKEKVSEFTTYFPYADYRNTNIGRAAELVDGTLLEPGETFSLNGIVGERTRENGFTDGFIISNGIFKEDLGGGVSQMATTLFNGMFFAGLEDVEHKPHSLYIDRYPVGREATVAWGVLDLRFRNDTDYGVLVNAEVTPSTPSSEGVVTVRMFSTKVWDIEATASDRYAYTAPATRTLRTPDCYPNTGYSGFQIDVTRIFRKAGESAVDHREKFHTTYIASDTVICKPPLPSRG